MGGIAEKLADALAMFWQSLDELERRALIVGGLWLVASLLALRQQERAEAEREERIAARVAERLAGGRR